MQIKTSTAVLISAIIMATSISSFFILNVYARKTCSANLKTTQEIINVITKDGLSIDNMSEVSTYIDSNKHNYQVCLANHGVNN